MHEAGQRDGAAEPERAEIEEVPHQVGKTRARRDHRRGRRHRRPSSEVVTVDSEYHSLLQCKTYALVDSPHDPAAQADPAPRRSLAEAPAHGGRQASRGQLDPARDSGDHGTVPVAGPGDPVVSGRGDLASGRPRRHDDGRGDRGSVPQSPKPGIPGGRAGLPRDPRAARSLPDEPPRLGRCAPRQAGWSEARAGPDTVHRLPRGAGRAARSRSLGDDGQAPEGRRDPPASEPAGAIARRYPRAAAPG